MHLQQSLALTALVASGVYSAPLLPAFYSNPIVAHVLNEVGTHTPSQETIVMATNSPRPSFIDSTTSSPFNVQDATPSVGLNHQAPSSAATKPIGHNIQKHVLWEVRMSPTKRSDSSQFYTLKVSDLQKGPFYKQDSDDAIYRASH